MICEYCFHPFVFYVRDKKKIDTIFELVVLGILLLYLALILTQTGIMGMVGRLSLVQTGIMGMVGRLSLVHFLT